MTLYSKTKQSGFTLIELLVVIGILAILLAITLIAINPNKHFEDSRNAQRQSDVTAILDAVYEYESANNGNAPAAVANVTSLAGAGEVARGTAQSPTSTTFATPHVTYPGLSGNAVTSGYVTVTSCSAGADNGTYAVTGSSSATIVVLNASGVAGATGCSVTAGIDLCSLTPTQIADMPKDPTTGTTTGGSSPCNGATTYDTGYTIAANGGRFTVAAPAAEDSQTISVTR